MKKFWEVCLVTSLFFMVLALWLPLTDQEAYYWLWSKHPALCYFDHPPLQAWITHISTLVFGDNVFAVRGPTFVTRAIGLWYFYRWARLRIDRNGAALALLVVISSFFFMGASLLALPDSFQFPFAMMVLYYADTRKPWACAVSLGLMALAKWTAAVYVPGVLAAFLLVPGKRREFLKVIGVGLLALLMQTPVLYWNAVRGWPSFMFHLETRHRPWSEVSLKFALGNLVIFIAAQFLLGAFGTVLLLFRTRISNWFQRMTSGYSPLWLWIVPAFLIFGYSSIKGEMRFYWTAPAFFPLVVALIQRSSKVIPSTLNFARVVGWTSYATCGLIFVILMYPVGAYLRPMTEKYSHFDMRQSPRGDIDGWDDWIRMLKDEQKLPVEQTAFVASDMRLAAQAAWGLRHDGEAFRNVGTSSVHQNAFADWPHPRPEQFKKVVVFWDNRYQEWLPLNDFCGSRAGWNTYQVKLKGEVIKEIHWWVCDFELKPQRAQGWQ